MDRWDLLCQVLNCRVRAAILVVDTLWVGIPQEKSLKDCQHFLPMGVELRPSAQPRGGPANKKKSSTNVPKGGGTIYLSFSTAFFCFLPKNVHCRMSNSPNLNCIFSGRK